MSDDSKTSYPDNFIIIIPDEYLIAIGKVCVWWGTLETVVDLAIAKLSGFQSPFDPRAMIVTAHMTWPLKMDIMASLITALREDQAYAHLARFDEIKPMLKNAQDGRNKCVHGQWGYDKGNVSKLRATARGRLKASIDTITVADIDKAADDIGRAGAGIVKLILNK
jgi:hypothetical protein